MLTFLAFFLTGLALYLLVLMVRQARRGQVDLLSLRNLFLMGFIVFQLTSGTTTLLAEYNDAFKINDWTRTGEVFTFLAVTFLVLFMVFYRWGVPATSLAARWRTVERDTGPYAMLLWSLLFLAGGALWRIVLVQIPVVSPLAMIVATGLSGTAAGLAAWAWAPRWSNPIVAAVAAMIIAGALGINLYQAFGRRDALNVLIACLWGAHHGHWKYIGFRRALVQILPLAAGALLFMAAFTAGRHQLTTDVKLSFGDSIARLGRGDLGQGFMDMAGGQGTAGCSMWVIENRPEAFPYDTFHTARYVVSFVIPRIYWAGKPGSLGADMPRQGRVPGKDYNSFSVGPGIIGHIVNDNPWLCMVPYAFGFAFLFRFMDQRIRLNPTNPFVIIPLGVALGDVLGLARGETGQFLARALIMMVSAWIGMSLFGRLFSALGLVRPAAEPSEEPGAEEPTDTGRSSDLIDPLLSAAYRAESDAGGGD